MVKYLFPITVPYLDYSYGYKCRERPIYQTALHHGCVLRIVSGLRRLFLRIFLNSYSTSPSLIGLTGIIGKIWYNTPT